VSRVTRWVCEKVAQNVAQPIICQNFICNWYRGKRSPKICVTSVFFKTLPKIINYPISEKSPNLGPMLWSHFSAIFDNVWRKNGRFFQKPMLWSNFCIFYDCFESKTPIFFAEFFGDNILKIIIGHWSPWLCPISSLHRSKFNNVRLARTFSIVCTPESWTALCAEKIRTKNRFLCKTS
jgi:hypothetical protein